ncbi:MAG TPA: PilZ domain-containing protein [Clostridia bacterium]|nr:PilZ domain-containing protein [Clostridia bacterium]
MPAFPSEQRATRRFPLKLPVTVRYAQGRPETNAQTRDVSSRGICFYMDSRLDTGSQIEFTLTLPPEITMTEAIRVRCRGKVVRVESPLPGGKIATAAEIDKYEFVSEQYGAAAV